MKFPFILDTNHTFGLVATIQGWKQHILNIKRFHPDWSLKKCESYLLGCRLHKDDKPSLIKPRFGRYEEYTQKMTLAQWQKR